MMLGRIFSTLFGKTQPADLVVSPALLATLAAMRREDKLQALPAEARERLVPQIDSLLERLMAGLADNPTHAWVLAQTLPTVAAFHLDDDTVKAACVARLRRIFSVLDMPGAGGAFREKFGVDF